MDIGGSGVTTHLGQNQIFVNKHDTIQFGLNSEMKIDKIMFLLIFALKDIDGKNCMFGYFGCGGGYLNPIFLIIFFHCYV